VLVVHDEGDFDLGRLELKVGGGYAGHNGLKSIGQALGGPDFLRLRIGVGRPERGDPRPLADYVLSNFEPHDDADALIARAVDAVEQIDADGVERAQARVNRRG
jgi:PTH1 family peptidyl-tRNA hydrolase